MSILSLQLLLEILMLVIQIGKKTTLLIQQPRNRLSYIITRYTQMIGKPTYGKNNSMSCIGLIFCTKQNVISKYRVDASILDKCHHNIIYGKIDIRVSLPSENVRKVWDYSRANVQNIKNSLKNFNWEKTLESLSIDSNLIFSMKHY